MWNRYKFKFTENYWLCICMKKWADLWRRNKGSVEKCCKIYDSIATVIHLQPIGSSTCYQIGYSDYRACLIL